MNEVYQDGIMLGKTNKASGYTISSNGSVVLGQEMDPHGGGFSDDQAFEGSLAGLNLWSQFLPVNVIKGMVSGVMNVNGNLLQWRNFTADHVFGNVAIRSESEAEIPGIF